jgi:hypothetical protein
MIFEPSNPDENSLSKPLIYTPPDKEVIYLSSDKTSCRKPALSTKSTVSQGSGSNDSTLDEEASKPGSSVEITDYFNYKPPPGPYSEEYEFLDYGTLEILLPYMRPYLYFEQQFKLRKKDRYEINENLPLLSKYFGTNLHLKNFELLDFINANRYNKCLNPACKVDKRQD